MNEEKIDKLTRQNILNQTRRDHQEAFVKRAADMGLVAVADTDVWFNRPRLFDVSDYQPIVDWKAIFDQDPNCAGSVIKIFEPYDNASCGSLDCNYWFEDTAAQHMTDIYNYTNASGVRKLISVYVFGNPARSASMDLTWYKSQDEGTPQEKLSKWMRDDPHIYGLIRALKIGWRKNPTDNMEALIAMPNAFYDEINMDWERWWKFYMSDKVAFVDPKNVLSPIVIGQVIRSTRKRVKLLIEWGVLPKTTKYSDYSANWFIQRYLTSPSGDQYSFDNSDTWCARYMTFSKSGIMSVMQMAELYKEIPDNFNFLPFGLPKKVQVTGDKLKIPEMRTKLGPTGLDGNVFLGTWEQMEEYYGRKILRGIGAIIPPPDSPPVIIPPVTVTKYYAQIRPTAVGLKLRTGPSTTAPILDYDFRPLPRFEIDGAPVASGAITWASLGRAFFAVKQNDTVYADVLSEETK